MHVQNLPGVTDCCLKSECRNNMQYFAPMFLYLYGAKPTRPFVEGKVLTKLCYSTCLTAEVSKPKTTMSPTVFAQLCRNESVHLGSGCDLCYLYPRIYRFSSENTPFLKHPITTVFIDQRQILTWPLWSTSLAGSARNQTAAGWPSTIGTAQ